MKWIAEACGAEIIGGAADVEVKAVCTDSRAAKAGDLFFAIKGDKFDGHDFINEVVANGVVAVVLEKSRRTWRSWRWMMFALRLAKLRQRGGNNLISPSSPSAVRTVRRR